MVLVNLSVLALNAVLSILTVLVLAVAQVPNWLPVASTQRVLQNDGIVVIAMTRMEGCAACTMSLSELRRELAAWSSRHKTRPVETFTLVRCQRDREVSYLRKRLVTLGLVLPDIGGARSQELTGGDRSIVAVVITGSRRVNIRTQEDVRSLH